MIQTEEKASEIMMAYLKQQFRSMMDNPPLITLSIEYPWGWLFYYNSKSFLEGKDELSYYVGNVPIFVDRYDETAQFLGSAWQTKEETVEEYRMDKGYEALPPGYDPKVRRYY